jgi:hypothetical protein
MRMDAAAAHAVGHRVSLAGTFTTAKSALCWPAGLLAGTFTWKTTSLSSLVISFSAGSAATSGGRP